MLNKIISISEIDFNTLEKEIFEFGCECARNLMEEILMKIDDQLVDKAINLETFGKISTNLAMKAAENVCISSYRNTAKNITELTGQSISEAVEEEKEKAKLKELLTYFSENKEGLLSYKERGLKIPEPPAGVEYRTLGTMEHHICDIIAQRMKHRKASWSISGAERLGKILTLKVCHILYEKVTNFSRIILPEKFTQEINATRPDKFY